MPYYAERIRRERFGLSQDEVRLPFQLDNVMDGLFTLANKLYGITFTPCPMHRATTRVCGCLTCAMPKART